MHRCPKCSFTEIGGPFYKKDMFGRESLEYYCRRCGYEEYGPMAKLLAER